jgi:hypothetical protein
MNKLFDGVAGIKAVSREEALRACKRNDTALEWTSKLHADARSFGLLCDGEGGGIITELGLGETPMTFDDDESLLKTWAELHAMFGYPLSEQDEELMELLGIHYDSPVWGLVQIAKQQAGV